MGRVRLKTVFFVFNLVVGVTFLLVFIMPLLFLGADVARMFWQANWYMAVLFVGALGCLNVYFISNWRFFGALEQEQWQEIVTILGARLRRWPLLRRSSVKLFVNACVVSARPEEIRKLEEDLRTKCPSLVRRNVLRFGVPYLLSSDGESVVRYFREFRPSRERKKTFRSSGKFSSHEGWIEWCYAFGLLMTGRTGEAHLVLDNLVRMTSPGIVQAVALYLLNAYEGPPPQDCSAEAPPEEGREVPPSAAEQKEDLLTHLPRDAWEKHLVAAQGELHVVILGTLLQDVALWLYGPEESGRIVPGP
ncbi:hypothetical protein AU468_05485 [Alkalispirochaeta sphaeroplastigenens]|uniref:Uncharacterized protein n=1 Tax=Alkalispirochaeta sphaeroplastigenens TaxID=1187066 RepID=A0A2S4JUW8_9SPIO|nr:hypothetical protein AU468_05485 [Alkalispirochaeta sphaeroplastigenens]